MNASRNALFAVLLTLGCATSIPSDEASVRQAMMGFMNALNALDADRMESFFTDDITAFVPTAQPDRVDGRAAVTRIFRDFVAGAGTARLNIVPEDMRVEVSGDLGVVTFNVRGSVTRRRTFIFRRGRSVVDQPLPRVGLRQKGNGGLKARRSTGTGVPIIRIFV
jgi:ketosteroid isomerase-like protein